MNRDQRRVAIVLSGGGARGAYEAGVLAHLFEEIYPKLGPGFEFDLVSGTSVGAVHAAYVVASARLEPRGRAQQLVETWSEMQLEHVMQLSFGDLLGIPLRALGVRRAAQRVRAGSAVLGGLVDIGPLERLVAERIPWRFLRANLSGPRPGALCVSCTEVRSGLVTVFMDGQLADPTPWSFDPHAQAIATQISAEHVRASAAIPFLFPAVRIGTRYYVDGGLRMNTPLSPALRLAADRVLVIALRHRRAPDEEAPAYPEEVITQPAFLAGKVLDALLMDRLEYELERIDLVNALIERGSEVCGEGFLDAINEAVRERRGEGYRLVRFETIRPSRDLGYVADECQKRDGGGRALGWLGSLLTRAARHGVREEADLLSYLYFDRCFTRELVALGRADARQEQDRILALLAD